MLNKSGILFSVPLLPKKSSLQSLNSSTTQLLESKLSGKALASFPPRTLRQILKIIENGSPEAISIIEWLYVFKSSEDWMFNEKNDEIRACILIWQTIAKHNSVSQMAFFKAALALDLKDGSFPQPLIDTAHIAKPLLKPLAQKKVEWIESLSKRDYLTCAKASYSVDLTVKQYIYQLGLPDVAKYVADIYQELVNSIDGELSVKSEHWLLKCIQESPNTDLVVEVVNEYLALNPEIVKDDDFDTWFEENCLPDVENSYYLKLNSNSKRKLKSLYRLSEFYKFKELIGLITKPKIANALKISDEHIKQLNNRVQFWSNYSDRFIQVKILIPVQTEMQLKQSYLTINNYDLLASTEEENSEVCIFEFDNTLVVEVFRGSLSEVRFFKKTDRNVNRLLQNDKLSIAEIRDMAQDEIHDHVVVWQYYCEQLLRKLFNIIPNDDIEYFSGIPKSKGLYSASSKQPLSSPSIALRQERKVQLDVWMSAFWEREYRTGKYKKVSKVQFDLDCNFYDVQKSKLFISDSSYWEELLELAKKGHNVAAHLTAKHYLLDQKTVKLGLYWLDRATALGYKESIDIIKKTEPRDNKTLDSEFKQLNMLPRGMNEHDKKCNNLIHNIEFFSSAGQPMLLNSSLYEAILKLLNSVTDQRLSERIDNPLAVLNKLDDQYMDKLINILINSKQDEALGRLHKYFLIEHYKNKSVFDKVAEYLSKNNLSLDNQFKALMLSKELGSRVYLNQFIELASQGHIESMILVGEKQLQSPYEKVNIQGKEWLAKAAKLQQKASCKTHSKDDSISVKSIRGNDTKPILNIIEKQINQNKPVVSGGVLYNSIIDLLSLVTVKSAVERVNNPLRILMRLSESNLSKLVDTLICNNKKIELTKLKAFLEPRITFQYLVPYVRKIDSYLVAEKSNSTTYNKRIYLKLSAMEITRKVKEFEKMKDNEELQVLLDEVKQRNTKAARTIQQNIESILRLAGARF